jgi:hypothetical protein
MNYQRIYDQIIDRAQKENREKGTGVYYEAHHIIPKCLGGEGRVSQWKTHSNVILLTAREHFLTHRLLTKIHPGNSKLVFAFWGMCNQKNKNQEERHTPSNRVYGEARELVSKATSIGKKAFYQTEEGRASKVRQVSNTDYQARTSNTDYQAFQQKRIANTDYETKAANTDQAARATKAVTNTDYIKRSANTDYVSRALKQFKPVLQLNKDETFIKEWISIKEAGETLKIGRSDISACCRGKQRTAGGFVWKYVK